MAVRRTMKRLHFSLVLSHVRIAKRNIDMVKRVSVCLSVTCWYCIKTTKNIVEKSFTMESLIVKIFVN